MSRGFFGGFSPAGARAKLGFNCSGRPGCPCSSGPTKRHYVRYSSTVLGICPWRGSHHATAACHRLVIFPARLSFSLAGLRPYPPPAGFLSGTGKTDSNVLLRGGLILGALNARDDRRAGVVGADFSAALRHYHARWSAHACLSSMVCCPWPLNIGRAITRATPPWRTFVQSATGKTDSTKARLSGLC